MGKSEFLKDVQDKENGERSSAVATLSEIGGSRMKNLKDNVIEII